jgi:hypothetical protein
MSLGSRFGDWQVCSVGGWNKHRIPESPIITRPVVSKHDFATPVPSAFPPAR